MFKNFNATVKANSQIKVQHTNQGLSGRLHPWFLQNAALF
jgi:hypothetical protein